MEFKELIELIESAGYSARSYSGRGMNGKQCLGIDTEHTDTMGVALDLIKEALGRVNTTRAYESIDEIQDLCELLKSARSDSMGRGYIIYFPAIKWEDMALDYDENFPSEADLDD